MLAGLLTMTLVSGCGLVEHTDSKEDRTYDVYEEPIETGMEQTPVISYEIPDMQIGVLVNRTGYSKDGEKKVFFRGSDLPAVFEVVDQESGQTVFTGRLQDVVYNALSGEYNGYGDFSEVTTEGRFLIRCDRIGYSQPFTVSAGYLKEMQEAGLTLLPDPRTLKDEDFVDICNTVSLLLLSYELYGDVYENPSGSELTENELIRKCRQYIEWLYEKQDSRTGAVYDEDVINFEKTAWLSAVLAKFSYTYQKYDSAYATGCLQAADKAWGAVYQREETQDALVFYAASELYRATGQSKYAKVQENIGKTLPEVADNGPQTFGTFTYAATKRKVDVELCGSLLMVLLNRAEEIAACSKDMPYEIGSSILSKEKKDILWEGVLIAATNYIITNQEYGTLAENYYNYLGGINETAECLIATEEESDSTDGTEIAACLMILSEMMSRQANRDLTE